MIRSPLGLRLQSDQPLREQIRQAASLGAKGVVLDASGDLAPDRLSETGRREIRQLLRSTELSLIAICLPTRRAFDTLDALDDRLARADRAMALAYELGTKIVLARVGAVPAEADADRLSAFSTAIRELGIRADHRGVRFALETGMEPGSVLAGFLTTLALPTLAVSIDPGRMLATGHDPVEAVRALSLWVVHAYANDATREARRSIIADPRGSAFPPGALDWVEYVGALEEINYRGFLTVLPDPTADAATAFKAMLNRAKQF